MNSPVLDYQVNDLLFGQPCFYAKVGDRQVVPGLGLILEVLALAQPSLLEAQVAGQV
ncbi:MAG TPA: hypothetical protein VMF91_27465 [Bryobacteraceae bacterium]|nr:hypothetical protein [Bryobacteraceae bacterium]